MSKLGKIALVLLLVASVGIGTAAYLSPHEDAQDALVLSFLVFWTILAALGIFALDWLIRRSGVASCVGAANSPRSSGPDSEPYLR